MAQVDNLASFFRRVLVEILLICATYCPECQLPDGRPPSESRNPTSNDSQAGKSASVEITPQGLPRWESDGPHTSKAAALEREYAFRQLVLPAQQYSRSNYAFRNLLNSKDQTVNDLCPVNTALSDLLTRRTNNGPSLTAWALRVAFLFLRFKFSC